jgi:hypothetical protein
MAAPWVSGIAALVRRIDRRGAWCIHEGIENNAVEYENRTGDPQDWGRVDAYRAVTIRDLCVRDD